MNNTLLLSGQKIKITHLEKIIFPDLKITKKEIIDYYFKIGKTILAYLVDRPVTIKRCPDGIKKECWIQKDAPENLPKFIKTYSVFSKSAGHKTNYILINDLATLIWLVNLGAIEFHIWLSRTNAPQIPDWILFDLDLEKGAKQGDIINAAKLVKNRLEEDKFKCFIKSTGLTGLHIIVENIGNWNFQKSREYVKKIVKELDQKFPQEIATEARIKKRRGFIYIDPAQNSKGRMMIAPYSLRAQKNATISTPLLWEELDKYRQNTADIKTIFSRIKEKNDVLDKLKK